MNIESSSERNRMDVGRMSRTNDAVSPVIGMVFLVAIVVVIVAIVAIVFMGLVPNHDAKDVGMQVTSDHTDVIVTLFTGRDVSELKSLRVSVAGNPYVNKSLITNTTDAVRQVGVPIRFTGVGTSGTHTTTVTGVFHDNTVVMLWTGKLAFDPWPADANPGLIGDTEYMIFVTPPNDWRIDNIVGEQFAPYGEHRWAWEKQLDILVYDSSGGPFTSWLAEGWYLDQRISNKESVIINPGTGKKFIPGETYRVEITGKVMDYTSGEGVLRSSVHLYTGYVSIPPN